MNELSAAGFCFLVRESERGFEFGIDAENKTRFVCSGSCIGNWRFYCVTEWAPSIRLKAVKLMQ